MAHEFKPMTDDEIKAYLQEYGLKGTSEQIKTFKIAYNKGSYATDIMLFPEYKKE